ncbi:MAG: hypothetical protein H7Z38_20355 [Rubrivivax sp.]|nr:hypothetical protein [Pyrinomonadaceae bacterium]
MTSLVVYGFAASGAQSQQDGVAASEEERKVENTVRGHVPIKVKLKNERSLKRMGNKNWARELEIEVKNTGIKPIYYVHLEIVMPEIIVDGGTLILGMAYGRKELAFPDEPVELGDIPILPGESVWLKIPESKAKPYEHFRDKENRWADPKRIEIEVQAVKFGDGTYLLGKEGKLMNVVPKKRSSNDPRPKIELGDCKPDPGVVKANLPSSLLQKVYSFQPASLLRADFSPLSKFPTSASLSTRRLRLPECRWLQMGEICRAKLPV